MLAYRMESCSACISCDYTNCAPPCLVSMFGSLKRTGGQPDVRWFGTNPLRTCLKIHLPEVEVIFVVSPPSPSRQLESFTILAGGCSQHEKASCVAITLDIGRSLDIDTWISKKKTIKIHFEKGVDFDILRWNFFRNFLHLKVWWIAGAPQFFGSQFYTYDLWRLGWKIDVWCGLEVFDHLCMVIICVPGTCGEKAWKIWRWCFGWVFRFSGVPIWSHWTSAILPWRFGPWLELQ